MSAFGGQGAAGFGAQAQQLLQAVNVLQQSIGQLAQVLEEVGSATKENTKASKESAKSFVDWAKEKGEKKATSFAADTASGVYQDALRGINTGSLSDFSASVNFNARRAFANVTGIGQQGLDAAQEAEQRTMGILGPIARAGGDTGALIAAGKPLQQMFLEQATRAQAIGNALHGQTERMLEDKRIDEWADTGIGHAIGGAIVEGETMLRGLLHRIRNFGGPNHK